MKSQDLQRFIRSSLNKGESPENIRQGLILAGWDEKSIDQAFAFVSKFSTTVPIKVRPTPNFALFVFYILYFASISSLYLSLIIFNEEMTARLFFKQSLIQDGNSLFSSIIALFIPCILFFITERNFQEYFRESKAWPMFLVLVSAASVGCIALAIYQSIVDSINHDFGPMQKAQRGYEILFAAALGAFYVGDFAAKKAAFAQHLSRLGLGLVVLCLLLPNMYFLRHQTGQFFSATSRDEIRTDRLRAIESLIYEYVYQKGQLPETLDRLQRWNHLRNMDRKYIDWEDPYTGDSFLYEILNQHQYRLCAQYESRNYPFGPHETIGKWKCQSNTVQLNSMQ